MNLIFGTDSIEAYTKAEKWVQQRYGTNLQLRHTITSGPHKGLKIGTIETMPLSIISEHQDEQYVLTIGELQHDLKTGSVSETLAAKTTPVKMLNIEGQFAATIVDKDETVSLIVDSSGMRTWYVTDDGMSFSSNIRLLAETQQKPKVDRRYEDLFLTHGFHPFKSTVYEGISLLSPGSITTWNDGWRGITPESQEHSTKLKLPETETEAVNGIHKHFMSALKSQMIPGVKHGVLLGGFDSALVAAALVDLGCEVETFSFGYEDESYNQPFAQELADHLGIKHHWVRVDAKQIADGYRNFTDTFNKPTNWPNYVISTAETTAAMVKEGVEIVFSGDGCDTVFLGYPGTAKRAQAIEYMNKVPSVVKKMLTRCLERPVLDRKMGHPYRVMMGLVRGTERTPAARTFLSFRIFDEISIRQLRSDISPVGAISVNETAETLAAPHQHLPSLRMAYAGKGLVSPNKNKIIGSSDLTGLTIWSPYMQSKLKHYALSLPETMMRPNEETESEITGKYILQKMAVDKQMLPHEMVYQPKVAAVDAPIDEWNTGPLSDALTEMWNFLPFKTNQDYLLALVKPKLTETLFKRFVMTDKVISHAANLLVTYGAFAEAEK